MIRAPVAWQIAFRMAGIVGMMPPSPTEEQLIAVGQLASRWSIGSILLLFIAGAVLFYFVDEDKGRQQAKYLSAD